MDIRLMSSNIRYDNPNDGDRSWQYRRDALLKSIHDFSPLILATQERREPQLRNLQEGLTHLVLADKHREWIAERMYPCLFYHPAHIEPSDSGDIWLSETPQVPGSKSFDSAFPRLLTWLRGRFIKNGAPFLAANVHLDHLEPHTRARQVQVLIQELTPLLNKEDAFILMGDFNESPDDEVRSLLRESFEDLYDPWFILDKNEEVSHHDLHGNTKTGSRIDWILVNRKFKPFDIYLDKHNFKGIYPSDHFPVKAILNLP